MAKHEPFSSILLRLKNNQLHANEPDVHLSERALDVMIENLHDSKKNPLLVLTLSVLYRTLDYSILTQSQMATLAS